MADQLVWAIRNRLKFSEMHTQTQILLISRIEKRIVEIKRKSKGKLSERKEQYRNEWQWFANTGKKSKAPNSWNLSDLWWQIFWKIVHRFAFSCILSDCIRIDMVFIREMHFMYRKAQNTISKNRKTNTKRKIFF